MAATMSGTVNHRVCSSSSPSPSPLLVRSSGITWRSDNFERTRQQCRLSSFLCCSPVNRSSLWPGLSSTLSIASSRQQNCLQVVACVPPSSQPQTTTTFTSSTKLYVSGLSFRTSEESLRNAFQSFGQLIEVNLVMDKIANRPRGFAFLRYATKEESEKAIEGMHGKFLDGRVIFVEFAKPRSQLPQGIKQDAKPYR
ncbi:organelle RRM domain-containing protein 6, chloroplastic [Cynara cardunculus var. scolymus]|uniref:organelle RRM domain-containing protein 6, chloroplastic n=1 Tax=Cynara cardunculus var. scolymus TaxID=59895 RepID=UPI000D62FB69|nr:organelle RRM domain-containing protein 6, chloroplastic [Cynara cardunculus var. scolymus]